MRQEELINEFKKAGIDASSRNIRSYWRTGDVAEANCLIEVGAIASFSVFLDIKYLSERPRGPWELEYLAYHPKTGKATVLDIRRDPDSYVDGASDLKIEMLRARCDLNTWVAGVLFGEGAAA